MPPAPEAADALAQAVADPPAETAMPAAADTAPVPPPARRHRPQPRRNEDDWPEPDLAGDAELYAIMYPQRAKLIRQLGGLPANCSFGPPEPDLVSAIVTGSSPALRALDVTAAGT